MSTLPVPHQWNVGDEVTATDLNTLVTAAQWVLTEPPVASAIQTSVQSIPYSAWTTITIDTVLYDSESGFNLAGDKYTAGTTGWYLVTGTVNLAQGASTSQAYSAFIRFIANGSATICGMGGCELIGTGTKSPYLQLLVYLSAGDYIQMQAWQNWGEGGTTSALSTAVNTSAPASEVSGFNLMWISA